MNFITGANGFVGKHLLKYIDATPIPHDKLQTIKLKPFENFYFLSGYGNMFDHNDDLETVKANVLDVVAMINQAVKFDFKSFVYISTSSVKLQKQQTMYSRSKKAAEEILLAYMEKYDKHICIIRPYSITGVGEQKEHLIPKLIESCITGKQMNFVGTPTHDFIDIDDAVQGILNLSSHRAKGIYELGTGTIRTNEEVLNLVEKVTGKKANINRVDSLRPYDNEHWVSNNFRSRGYGWNYKKSLEDSITEMVKDYENN